MRPSLTGATLAHPVHDCIGQRLELLPVRMRAEEGARARSVVERGDTRTLDRAGRGDAQQRARERTTCERVADQLVLLRRAQERHRRRPLAEVGTRDLPGLLRLAGAVEDVVGDLEGEAE